MFRKLGFRWLNIQIAPLPVAPRSPLSSQLWLSVLRMRSCCTHPSQWWEASFSTPRPWRFIQEARLWCARNMKDAGLSASCQLGNYPASLPGAAEPTWEPAWPSSAQQLCRWWTWLIPRNAGLSSCSSVNDFIQQGEVTGGLVIKGLHFKIKTARLCAALQKRPLRKKRTKKEENIQVSLAPEWQSLSKRRAERTSSHSCLLSSFLSPIVEGIIIGRPMNY